MARKRMAGASVHVSRHAAASRKSAAVGHARAASDRRTVETVTARHPRRGGSRRPRHPASTDAARALTAARSPAYRRSVQNSLSVVHRLLALAAAAAVVVAVDGVAATPLDLTGRYAGRYLVDGTTAALGL